MIFNYGTSKQHT